MNWDEFKENAKKECKGLATTEQTDIDCPKCGKKVWKRLDIVLTSFPLQYQYECECGWIGYAFE